MMLALLCFLNTRNQLTKALFGSHLLLESAERNKCSSTILNCSSTNSVPGVMERSGTEQSPNFRFQATDTQLNWKKKIILAGWVKHDGSRSRDPVHPNSGRSFSSRDENPTDPWQPDRACAPPLLPLGASSRSRSRRLLRISRAPPPISDALQLQVRCPRRSRTL